MRFIERSLAAAFQGLLVLAVGCGQSAGSADNGGGGTPNGSGGGDTAPGCVPGSNCACSDSSIGTTTCNFGTVVCECEDPSCDDVEPFEPSVASEPAPTCGGDPVGTWELVRIDYDGAPFRITSSESTTDCPARGTLEDTPVSAIRIRADQTADAYTSQFSVRWQFEDNCGGNACSTLDANLGCEASCGLCECSVFFSEGVDFEDGGWKIDDSGLILGEDLEGLVGVPFCVEGDELRMKREKDALWVLRRVFETNPFCPLSYYNSEDCTFLTRSEAECVAYDVPLDCAKLLPEECPQLPGCECAGSPDSCVCSGTPTPCPEIAVDDCNATPRCKLVKKD